MEDCLYDTSWVLHYVEQSSESFESLTGFDRRALKRPAKFLEDFLLARHSTYEDESETEKTGGLRECTWNPIKAAPNDIRTGILIQLHYEKVTYKLVLYSTKDRTYSFLLAKVPAALLQKFTTFLFSVYKTTIQPLKLPSTLLYDTLQAYLSIILETAAKTDPPTSTLARACLSALKLTFSFSAPVSPNLKALDIDIPLSSLTSPANSNKDILAAISQSLSKATGILPLALGFESSGKENANALARISKVSCGGFAISVDGRLKFSSKAVEAAVQQEGVVRGANETLFDAVVEEAKRRTHTSPG